MKKLFCLLTLLSITSFSAFAADLEFSVIIKDHQFLPADIHVPAGQKFKLKVENQDATPEEFESHKLNREKVIAPGTTATIVIGPLEPGRYGFVGEFHEDTARGHIIAE